MLSEQEIQAIQATGVDRPTAELIAAEQYINRRAEQIKANGRAAGVLPATTEWVRLDAALPWLNFRPSSALEAPMPTSHPQPTNMGTPIPPQSMSFQPSCGCAMCDGAGFYKLAVPVGHPQFGQLLPCTCTLAARERRDAERLEVFAAQLLRYRDCRLATFDLQRQISGPLVWQGQTLDIHQQRQALVEAHRTASAYVANPRGWLYLYGPPGSGKTRLAASIANEFRDRGIHATYGRIQALLDWLKAGFRAGEPLDFDQRLRTLERAPLLLLDDLGTEHGTAWERTILENLLNERYNRELPTVLTSNAWRDELPARIADRVAEMARVIWLLVGSHRRTQLGMEAAQESSGQQLDPWDRGEGEEAHREA